MPSDFQLEVARGNFPGSTFVHKFGKSPDFDSSDGFVTVHDGANDAFANQQNNYVYSATADIDSLSSSAGDTVDIEVQGLDTNYNLSTETVTLTGTTPVSLPTTLIRVFRLKNVGATDLVGTVYCYVSGGTVTAGVPQVAADIRARITIGANQTLMAVYTVPVSKKGYLCCIHVSLAGAIKTSAHVFHLRVRAFGQVFQLKHTGSVLAVGSSHINHVFDIPEIIPAKADIEIEVNTDTNVAAVSAGFELIIVDD